MIHPFEDFTLRILHALAQFSVNFYAVFSSHRCTIKVQVRFCTIKVQRYAWAMTLREEGALHAVKNGVALTSRYKAT